MRNTFILPWKLIDVHMSIFTAELGEATPYQSSINFQGAIYCHKKCRILMT